MPSKKHQSENPLRKFLNGCLNDFSAKITKKEKLKSRQKNFNVWTTNLKISKNSKFSSINADQITRALSVLKIWNYFAIEILFLDPFNLFQMINFVKNPKMSYQTVVTKNFFAFTFVEKRHLEVSVVELLKGKKMFAMKNAF